MSNIKEIILKDSKVKGKRYAAIIISDKRKKTVNFGSNMENFTMHGD
jgi:hypothetical protein